MLSGRGYWRPALGLRLSANDVPPRPPDESSADFPGTVLVMASGWRRKGPSASWGGSLSFRTPCPPAPAASGVHGVSELLSTRSSGLQAPTPTRKWALALPGPPAHLQAPRPRVAGASLMRDHKCVSINVLYLALKKPLPCVLSGVCSHHEDALGQWETPREPFLPHPVTLLSTQLLRLSPAVCLHLGVLPLLVECPLLGQRELWSATLFCAGSRQCHPCSPTAAPAPLGTWVPAPTPHLTACQACAANMVPARRCAVCPHRAPRGGQLHHLLLLPSPPTSQEAGLASLRPAPPCFPQLAGARLQGACLERDGLQQGWAGGYLTAPPLPSVSPWKGPPWAPAVQPGTCSLPGAEKRAGQRLGAQVRSRALPCTEPGEGRRAALRAPARRHG